MKWWKIPIRPKPSVLEKLHAAMSESCEVLRDFDLVRRVIISTLDSDEPLVRVLRGKKIHRVHPIQFLLEDVLDDPPTLVDAVKRVAEWSLDGVIELRTVLEEVTETPNVALGYLLEIRRAFTSAVPKYLEEPKLEIVAAPLLIEVALMACAEGLLEDDDIEKAAKLVAQAVDTEPRIVEALPLLEIRCEDIIPELASPAHVWGTFTLLCHTCANRLPPLEELAEPLENIELGPVDELETLNERLEKIVIDLEIDDEQVENWISNVLVDTVENAVKIVEFLSQPTRLAENILNSGAIIKVGWIEIRPEEYDPIWEKKCKGTEEDLYSRIRKIQNIIGMDHAEDVIEMSSSLEFELPDDEIEVSVETLRNTTD